MRKEKQPFKPVKYYVDVKDGEHFISLEFGSEGSALIYEKILELESLIKSNNSLEETMTKEEENTLNKLLKKQNDSKKKD